MTPRRPDAAQRALTYARRLLTYRPRSVAELTRRLHSRAVSPEIIRFVIATLRASAELDDEAFATLWTAARLRRGLGRRRIHQELLEKGLASGLAERALSREAPEGGERERAAAAAKIRLERLHGLPRTVQTRRLAGYLMRQGYPTGLIYETLNTVLGAP